MEKLKLISKDLKSGARIILSTIDKDDYREAEISFMRKWQRYIVWFNGCVIYSCRGVKELSDRIEKLNEKFPLEYKETLKF